MTRRLERLVYQSTATGTTGSLTNLAPILAESQRNNERSGLTGALAAHRDRYIQVIEGDAEVLDGLLRRLEKDPRHRDIVILEREPIQTCTFPDWSMASARVSPEMAPALDALMAEPSPSGARVASALREALEAQAQGR